MTTSKPIPGLRGPEHIGITVPNLSDAVAFFEDVFGAEVLYTVGPFASDDDWMAENLDVDARAVIPKIAMIRIENGPAIEVFEYIAADQRADPPRNSDVGGHHIAFYVDDMAAAVSDLRARNLTVIGEPKEIDEGPSAGLSWVYFKAPWGLHLELVSYPKGVAAYRNRERPVWHP